MSTEQLALAHRAPPFRTQHSLLTLALRTRFSAPRTAHSASGGTGHQLLITNHWVCALSTVVGAMRDDGHKEGIRQHILGNAVEPANRITPEDERLEQIAAEL